MVGKLSPLPVSEASPGAGERGTRGGAPLGEFEFELGHAPAGIVGDRFFPADGPAERGPTARERLMGYPQSPTTAAPSTPSTTNSKAVKSLR